MKFNLPTMINFLHTNRGSTIGIGEVDENDFEKWFIQYVTGLRKHYKKKRELVQQRKDADEKNQLMAHVVSRSETEITKKLISLLDSCMPIIEIWQPKSIFQFKWKREWLDSVNNELERYKLTTPNSLIERKR
jgi:hypothetical protein